jgi:septal ring factor EnvC (AmiA/AmiB activator)
MNLVRVRRTIARPLAAALNALAVAAVVCVFTTAWTTLADDGGEGAGVAFEGGWTILNGLIAMVTVVASVLTARAQRRQDRDSELYARIERQVKLLEGRVTSEVERSKILEAEIAACHEAREEQRHTIAEQQTRITALEKTSRAQDERIDDLIERLTRATLDPRPAHDRA